MSEHAPDSSDDEPNLVFLALLVLGGLCAGVGLINLYWSFGWPEGDLNENFAEVGFSGLDNISLLAPAEYSIVLVVVGLLAMIGANAMAWKHTDGY